MSSARINVDQLAVEVVHELEAYRDATVDIVEYAVKKTAKETVEDIRENIKEAGIQGSGEYAKGWKAKKTPFGKHWGYAMTIYNKDKYRIAHLLEHGHAKRNGGRVKAYPHLKPAEELAEKNMIFYIKSGIAQIKGGGR